MQVHNYKKRKAYGYNSLEKSNLSKVNIDLFKDFIDEYGTDKSLSTARIGKYLTNFRIVIEMLSKDLDKATVADMRKLVHKIKERQVSERTMEDYWVLTKVFYRWFEKARKKQASKISDTVEYVKEFVWKVDKNKIKEPDILTLDEIKQIVGACKSERDRALVMMLWDSGARIGELITLRNKDVNSFEHGFRINIQQSKTTKRTLPLVECAPYITNYINREHISYGKDPSGSFWIDYTGNPLSYDGVRVQLKRIFKRAMKPKEDDKPIKRVYAHLFRHSRATDLANRGWSEAQMCKWFGWRMGSDMPAVYIKRSGVELEDTMLVSLGIKKKDEEEDKKGLKPVKCIFCEEVNEATNIYCKKCQKPLRPEEIRKMEIQKDDKFAQAQKIVDLLSNEKVEKLITLYDELVKK